MNKKNKVSKKELREARKPKFAPPKPKAVEKAEAVAEERKPVYVVQKKFSKAKAAGLKSTFTLSPDTVLMTSFGKGNDAKREYRFVRGGKEELTAEHVFSADVLDPAARFDIRGRIVDNASADNPLYVSAAKAAEKPTAGNDLIHIREPLEKMIFGQNFEDNIHVQLAYSILDIDKIRFFTVSWGMNAVKRIIASP